MARLVRLDEDDWEDLCEFLMFAQDDGPPGEGWKSPMLDRAWRAVQEAVVVDDGAPRAGIRCRRACNRIWSSSDEMAS